jgi:phosphatidylserine/phosphatidylglycerophosphate/cardiolipin synthase-like enzyme
MQCGQAVMIFGLFTRKRIDPTPLLSSRLFDDQTFYASFLHDLQRSRKEVFIESPFITTRRMTQIYPVLHKLARRGVTITVNTRDPQEHEPRMRDEAMGAIAAIQDLDVIVLYTKNHHRKFAVIDSEILWEGSLNILSQWASCEVMRRIESGPLAQEMLGFAKLDRFKRKL